MTDKIKKTLLENVRSLVFGLVMFLTAAGMLVMSNIQSSRAQLSGVQTWLGTAGGSANALTVSVHNILALNDILGVPLRLIPASQNTASATVTITLDNTSTLGPITIKRPTSNIGLQNLSGAELQVGQMIELVYDGTVLNLKSPIDMTPIGNSVEVRGSSAPLGTLVEDGTCYSQTTYAALFSVVGSTYNAAAPVACTGGNFAVPDSRGSFFAALDTQGSQGAASRLTSGGSGCTATAVGTRCGGQSSTLITANLPPYTPVGTNGGTQSLTWLAFAGGSGQTSGNPATGAAISNLAQNINGSSFTFTGTAQGGTSTPFSNVSPVLLGVRAIKY